MLDPSLVEPSQIPLQDTLACLTTTSSGLIPTFSPASWSSLLQPRVFFSVSFFWRKWVYNLPDLSSFDAALNSAKSLQKKPPQDTIMTTTYNGVNQGKPDGIYQPQNTRELFCVPIIRAICLSGCALSFISTSFDVVFVLFCFSPIDLGGLGFSVRRFPVVVLMER